MEKQGDKGKESGAMSVSAADETVRMDSGPSEVDPFAREWAEERQNILRAFLFVQGDDGVDYGAERLAGMDQEALVLACSQWQGKYAVDRPWVQEVVDCWQGDEGKAACTQWSWSMEDTEDLMEILAQEKRIEKGKRKRRSRSPGGRGRSGVPAQQDGQVRRSERLSVQDSGFTSDEERPLSEVRQAMAGSRGRSAPARTGDRQAAGPSDGGKGSHSSPATQKALRKSQADIAQIKKWMEKMQRQDTGTDSDSEEEGRTGKKGRKVPPKRKEGSGSKKEGSKSRRGRSGHRKADSSSEEEARKSRKRRKAGRRSRARSVSTSSDSSSESSSSSSTSSESSSSSSSDSSSSKRRKRRSKSGHSKQKKQYKKGKKPAKKISKKERARHVLSVA